jgi:hypothetical protein
MVHGEDRPASTWPSVSSWVSTGVSSPGPREVIDAMAGWLSPLPGATWPGVTLLAHRVGSFMIEENY